MKTYALVGKSGTGKSFQAMSLCQRMEIAGIIDDGLFVMGGSVVAGTSAKRQETKIGAIKTALFTDPAHQAAVREKIAELAPESLLVLGTSEEMIGKIITRLGLPQPSAIIPIEAITTEAERNIALRQRTEKGKHVIPAPTFQIKRDFSGYFVDPLRLFRGRGDKSQIGERTVVRPTFSYLGEYFISDRVITDIVSYIGDHTPGVASVIRVVTENSRDGVNIQVLLLVFYGFMVMDVALEVQQQVARQVEAMTAFNIMSVDVEVRGLK